MYEVSLALSAARLFAMRAYEIDLGVVGCRRHREVNCKVEVIVPAETGIGHSIRVGASTSQQFIGLSVFGSRIPAKDHGLGTVQRTAYPT